MVRRAPHGSKGSKTRRNAQAKSALVHGIALGGACELGHDSVSWEGQSLAEGYASRFGEIRIALERNEGFMLLPVDVPSRDVGRALFDNLLKHGLEPRLLDPLPEEWAFLPTLLLSAPAGEKGPLVVLGPREKSKDVLLGIQRANLMRDSLIEHLNRPLLWCGQSFFLDATRDGAPDFWSVREIIERIPLRAGAHQQVDRSWDPFVRKPPPMSELEARVQKARETRDNPNLLRALLSLSRASIGLGRAGEALSLVEEAGSLLESIAGLHSYTLVEAALFRELRGDVKAALQGFAEAEELYEEALYAYRHISDDYASIRLLGKLGLAAARNRNHALAEQRFNEALGELNRAGDDMLRAELLLARSEWYSDIEVALHLFREQGDDWGCGRALLMRGRHRQEHDDFEGAAKDFDEAIERMEKSGDAVGLAGAYLGGGVLACYGYSDIKKAGPYLDKAIDYAALVRDLDTLEQARAHRGECRFRFLNDDEGALEDLDFALRRAQDPEHWAQSSYVYFQRGQLHHSRARYEQSAADFEQAIELGEKSAGRGSMIKFNYYFYLCHNYINHLNRLSAAEPIFRKVKGLVEQDPGNQNLRAGYLWLRGTFYESGAFGEATEGLSKADPEGMHAEASPGDQDSMETQFQEALQDYAEARAILKAQGDDFSAATVEVCRAKLLARLQRWGEALDALKQVLEFARSSRNLDMETSALSLRASVYLIGRNLWRAARDLNPARAKACSPKANQHMGAVLLGLSELELRRGRFWHALDLLRRLEEAALAQKNPLMQIALLVKKSEVYLILGYATEARALAARALELCTHGDLPASNIVELQASAKNLIAICSLEPFAFRLASHQLRRSVVVPHGKRRSRHASRLRKQVH